ncbi:MAG: PLP-dependent aminotransferase family protein [Clostridiaceae bacterium]|nr:PLP-dependent aminotransferase family protein [Clostridiaceae bacterium]
MLKKEKSDMMRININRSSDTPIYMQIKNQIRDMIISGELPAGHILLPERVLSELINVNRTTVVNAYHELKADGLAEARVGKGTIVTVKPFKGRFNNIRQYSSIPWYQFFNESMDSEDSHIISDIMDINCTEDIISFSGGFPSPALYPLADLGKIQERLLRVHGKQLFLHSPVEGLPSLRAGISSLMKARNVSIGAKDIMILSGSQQGLDYVARVFIKPGDTVILEEPSFFGAIQIFRSAGAKIIGVPTDSQGMRTDILESLIQRYEPKFIYALPTFQNPSGTVMSLERRYELLDLSYKYRIPIVEDDPYGDLRYEGKGIPPLKALDPYEHVIYLSTFSKVLSLGLRIGWVAASQQVIRKFAYLKQMTDMHVNTPGQYMISEFLSQGCYEKHLNTVLTEYSKKRDLMDGALEKYKLPGVLWEKPEGGYYIWCRLPEYVTNNRLVSKAAEKGVVYLPGEIFYPDGTQGENFMRLNFTFPDSSKIEEGIKRLMDALTEVEARDKSDPADRAYSRRPIV